MNKEKARIAFSLRNASTREKADQLVAWGADPSMFSEHTGGARKAGAAGALAGFAALVKEGYKLQDYESDSEKRNL